MVKYPVDYNVIKMLYYNPRMKFLLTKIHGYKRVNTIFPLMLRFLKLKMDKNNT
jgi:hypothetical protein